MDFEDNQLTGMTTVLDDIGIKNDDNYEVTISSSLYEQLFLIESVSCV